MKTLKEMAFDIASFGVIGQWLSRGLIASALALPASLIFKGLYTIHPQTTIVFAVTLAILGVFIIQLAIWQSPEKTPMIVLDKFMGTTLVMAYIPFTTKFAVVGYMLFHIFNVVLPFIIWKMYSRSLHNLPGALGIIASDFFAGIFANLVLQSAIWLVS
jgi:phosphatidylglycerophosphatase A